MSLTWTPDPIQRHQFRDGPYWGRIVQEGNGTWKYEVFYLHPRGGDDLLDDGVEVIESHARMRCERAVAKDKERKSCPKTP